MAARAESSVATPLHASGMTQHFDAVSFLTCYLVVSYVIEARLVIRPLGGAGSPALLVACAGFVWWAYYQVQRPVHSSRRREPVRLALLCLLLSFLGSFVAAMSRPIASVEMSTAQFGMIAVVGWMGVGLLANDGIPRLDRFETLVSRLVLLTTGMAVLGLAQFLTDDPLVRSFTIPGLVPNSPLGGLGLRSGFSRPFGTTLHPIEFGAVITAVLPLALVWGRRRTDLAAILRWLPAALMGLSVVASISRSAVICGGAGLLILATTWSPRARRGLGIALVVLVAAVALLRPGVIGSIARLFAASGQDGSVLSRTESYSVALGFFENSPLLGRGYSTFLPSYRIFDNQYLLLLVEVGIVGLLVWLAVIGTALRCARLARAVSRDETTREYGQALFAAIAAGALGLAFYDGLSFPTATGVLFLLTGMTGSLLRLVRPEHH